MGLTQRLGTIPLAIQTDSSNNVGIGGAANASYKLDVIGTTRVSTALTISSTTNAGLIAATNSTTGYTYLDLINNGASGRNYQIGVGGNAAASGYANNLYFDLVGVGNIMTLTSGRNVGIGTSSPQSLLDVRGATPFIRITDSSVTGETGLIMDAGGGLIRGGLTINYGTGEYKSYCGAAGNAYFQTFHTNGSERMRITSGGEVCVRTISASYASTNRGNITIGGSSDSILAFQVNGIARSYLYAGATDTFLDNATGTGIVAVLNGTGGVQLTRNASSWSAYISDVRKKKNFENTQGLAEVLQIEPIKYHLIDDDDNDRKRLGFKAQNIQPLIPEMVHPNGQKADDGTDILTITPDYLLPVLVKAIQELNAKVTALENK